VANGWDTKVNGVKKYNSIIAIKDNKKLADIVKCKSTLVGGFENKYSLQTTTSG